MFDVTGEQTRLRKRYFDDQQPISGVTLMVAHGHVEPGDHLMLLPNGRVTRCDAPTTHVAIEKAQDGHVFRVLLRVEDAPCH